MIPVAASAFPREILPTPRRWAERNYRQLVHWGDMERGGHFAALARAQFMVQEAGREAPPIAIEKL